MSKREKERKVREERVIKKREKESTGNRPTVYDEKTFKMWNMNSDKFISFFRL